MSAPVLKGAFAARLPHSRTFRAFRVPASGTAIPLDIGAPATLAEATDAAMLGNGFQPKETLFIHEVDDARRRGVLYTFAVKQLSRAIWVRDPATGVSRAERKIYPDPLCAVAMDSFEPTRRFDAFRDCPVGADLTLVEG
jgi:hypothetical protein